MEDESKKSAFDDFMKDIEDKSDESNHDISNNVISTKVDISGRTNKKMEFSKKILIYAGIINAIVIFATLYVVIMTYNTSPLNYLIPSVAAEVASGTIFYYRKSMLENCIRILLDYNVVITEGIIGKILSK